MVFRGKNIIEYDSLDIQSLIDNKVPESRTLDYKRELKFDEKSKVELLYDISSFYNTDGGCLVIGLDELKDENDRKTGIPVLPDEKVIIKNFDELKLRIEEVIRQSTNPQIANLVFSQLLSLNNSNVFLIGIPKTRSLPSMVTYSNNNRFYKRKSNGKYILDTYELYDTFLQVNLMEDKIAEFIKERQIAVFEDKFWEGIGSLHSVLIHTIPIHSFNNQIENFSNYEMQKFFIEELKVPGRHSYSYRYCLEGFHLYSNRLPNSPEVIIPYNLIFRNGIIETFSNEPFFTSNSEKLYLDSTVMLTMIKEQVAKSFKIYKDLFGEMSFYISIKLQNIKNLYLNSRLLNAMKFRNNELQLPITLMSEDIAEGKKSLKNILDILWQSTGNNECPLNEFNKIFDSF